MQTHRQVKNSQIAFNTLIGNRVIMLDESSHQTVDHALSRGRQVFKRNNAHILPQQNVAQYLYRLLGKGSTFAE